MRRVVPRRLRPCRPQVFAQAATELKSGAGARAPGQIDHIVVGTVGHKAARPQGVQGCGVEGNVRHGEVHLAQGIGALILFAGDPLHCDRHLTGHPVSTIRQTVEVRLLDGVFARELANDELAVAADPEGTDLKGLGGHEDMEQALPLGDVVGRMTQGAMTGPCRVAQRGVKPGAPRGGSE